MLSEKQMEVLRECWRRSPGKAWEPQGGTATPLIRKFIEAGYLRAVDGRCGFEKFKDSMVTWTEAGKAAMSQTPAPSTREVCTPTSTQEQEGSDE
jgi:hypothetical protein